MLSSRHREAHTEEDDSKSAIFHRLCDLFNIGSWDPCHRFRKRFASESHTQRIHKLVVSSLLGLDEDIGVLSGFGLTHIDHDFSSVGLTPLSEEAALVQRVPAHVARMCVYGVAPPVKHRICAIDDLTESAAWDADRLYRQNRRPVTTHRCIVHRAAYAFGKRHASLLRLAMSRAPPIEKRVFGVNENLCRLVYRLVHRAVDELPPSADARMQVPIRRLSRHKLIVADDARISRLANLFGIVDVYFEVIT